MDTGLRERVVLVTGGSSGIGAATAVAFAREGAKVAITYRKGEEAARAVAAAITEAGGEPFVTPMDLEDLPSARRAVDAVLARWGAGGRARGQRRPLGRRRARPDGPVRGRAGRGVAGHGGRQPGGRRGRRAGRAARHACPRLGGGSC
ncbi:SDR family NAD(P)-dependent oxidoreductase [Nonomuraea ferruginea]